jgi:probable F420-dependent oxidoreductase
MRSSCPSGRRSPYGARVKPFRFVIDASRAASGSAWLEMARRAEDLGYAALYMPDHLGAQYSPLPALAAAAAVTTRLRVAPYVAANDYRHPLMLARELATIDVLSGGRVEVGIGAGWRIPDYRQLGLAYDPPAVRIDRLVESISILKRLLAGETVSHEDRYYHLDRARLEPRPVQRPMPPLIIGGGGPRMLRLAAREADIVGLIPQFDARGRPIVAQATERATAAKAAIVREAAGARWDSLSLDVNVADAGIVGSGAGPLESVTTAAKATVVALIGTPYVLYGTLPRLRTLLEQRRERLGINQYSLPVRVMDAMAPLVEALAGR